MPRIPRRRLPRGRTMPCEKISAKPGLVVCDRLAGLLPARQNGDYVVWEEYDA